MKVFYHTNNQVESIGKLNKPNEYKPFVLSEEAKHKSKIVEEHVEKWEKLLYTINPDEFFALHSWYNEKEQYDMALLCLLITIARKGTSKNYSFCSANLRKIGRYKEAEYFALMTLNLNENNLDAFYNLGVIYKQMGLDNKAEYYINKFLDSDEDIYKSKLKNYFQDIQI